MSKRAANFVRDDAQPHNLSSSLPPPVAAPASSTPQRTSAETNPRSLETVKRVSGGTTTSSHRIRAHHFPLYSHPMFRAAAHNAEAVRSAIDAQAQQVDHAALDDAVENLVAQLLQQQQSSEVDGAGAGPAVSEAQLLALLASVSRNTPAPPGSLSSPPRHEVDESTSASPHEESPTAPPLSAETFACPAGLQQRHLPHTTRCHPYSPTSSTSPYAAKGTPQTRDDDDGVQVVSVNALQKASMAYARRTSQTGTSPSEKPVAKERPFMTLNASHIPHGAAPVGVTPSASSATSLFNTTPSHSPAAASPLPSTSRVGAATASLRPLPKTQSNRTAVAAATASKATAGARSRPAARATTTAPLYSLLPLSSVDTRRCDAEGGGGHDTTQIASGTVSHGITFAEMDRRPGVGTGPVAQQSVDAQHLQHVSDSAFAAMDVLMDGNSCCVRRRQRGAAKAASHSSSGVPSFAAASYTMGGPMPLSGPPPLPPPPRTAAEAKARRILEAQRRRQRLHAPPPGNDADTTAASHTSGGGGKNGGGIASFASPSEALPPLSTTRGMASSSLFTQAVNSAHQYNRLYK